MCHSDLDVLWRPEACWTHRWVSTGKTFTALLSSLPQRWTQSKLWWLSPFAYVLLFRMLDVLECMAVHLRNGCVPFIQAVYSFCCPCALGREKDVTFYGHAFVLKDCHVALEYQAAATFVRPHLHLHSSLWNSTLACYAWFTSCPAAWTQVEGDGFSDLYFMCLAIEDKHTIYNTCYCHGMESCHFWEPKSWDMTQPFCWKGLSCKTLPWNSLSAKGCSNIIAHAKGPTAHSFYGPNGCCQIFWLCLWTAEDWWSVPGAKLTVGFVPFVSFVWLPLETTCDFSTDSAVCMSQQPRCLSCATPKMHLTFHPRLLESLARCHGKLPVDWTLPHRCLPRSLPGRWEEERRQRKQKEQEEEFQSHFVLYVTVHVLLFPFHFLIVNSGLRVSWPPRWLPLIPELNLPALPVIPCPPGFVMSRCEDVVQMVETNEMMAEMPLASKC